MKRPGPLFSAICAILTLAVVAPRLESRGRKDGVQYGEGLIVNIPAPEAEVLKAVEEVTQNGLIRGSKEYSKDEYINGATAATDSRLFPPWSEGGKIFYKIRRQVLDPRNFKDSGDLGTLAVRYIVTGQGDKNTVLRIDAVFVEDFRHTVHPSNGSVEGAEYKDIHDLIDAIELLKQQTAEAEKQKQEFIRKKSLENTSAQSSPVTSQAVPEPIAAAPQPVAVDSSAQTLEQRVQELRSQVQRRVKSPGAPLKSAPFRTASNLQPLPPGTEVLIMISTPYWYGVETHEGQHGWMLRNDLEEVP